MEKLAVLKNSSISLALSDDFLARVIVDAVEGPFTMLLDAYGAMLITECSSSCYAYEEEHCPP